MPTSGRDSRDRVDLDRGLVMLAKGEGKRKGRATVPTTDRLRATLEAARPAAIWFI